MEILIETTTPVNTKLCAKYKRSFAYPTVTDRLPVILTSIIDVLVRDKNDLSDDSKTETKALIGELSELKYIMQTGKVLNHFTSNEVDTELWNRDIERLEQQVDELTFYSAPWLFVECYLYRRIREVFSLSTTLKDYDPFTDKKVAVLENSLPAIKPLMDNLTENKILDSHPLKTTDLINEFIKLIKNCLWANRVDLSLSSGRMENCCAALDIDAWDSFILVNDVEKVLDLLFSPGESEGTKKIVDYVMDNSGLEILCDLCLADFLVSRCKVDHIRLRVKRIPWFVSDVTRSDLKHTLHRLSTIDSSLCQFFAKRWQEYLDKGLWTVHDDSFWTLGLSFDEMSTYDSSLYNSLSEAFLIIFKGDLNYRKLIQDTNWETTTPMSEAVGRFRPAPFVALRTLKADTIAGLHPGTAAKLDSETPDWLVSGKYGVIQFLEKQ
nr:glutamate O-methyltransferase [Rhagovelia obesa]